MKNTMKASLCLSHLLRFYNSHNEEKGRNLGKSRKVLILAVYTRRTPCNMCVYEDSRMYLLRH